MKLLLVLRQTTRCWSLPRSSSSSTPNVPKKIRKSTKNIDALSTPASPSLAAGSASAQINNPAHLPFTILPPIEALADTLGEDPTAAHYSFADDPALTPTSRRSHVRYFMAKEMGKRAARKLAEEWPSLFAFDRDQPYLGAFRPIKPLDPQIVVANEENLKAMIDNKQVIDAKELYQRMEKAGEEECSAETLVCEAAIVSLFHLLCYYYELDPPFDESEWPGLRNLTAELEQSVGGVSRKPKPTVQRTSGGLIDQLFERLDKTPEIYSAMICHLCKFASASLHDPNIKRAEAMFKEMIGKEMQPSEEVFEFLFKSAVARGEHERKALWEMMQKLGIRPSVEMFNAQLDSLHIEAVDKL